jgi:hypothetical protein
MKTIDKLTDWAEQIMLTMKTMALMSLTKMGYKEEDAWEAIEIFWYLDYKLFIKRIKERRLKWDKACEKNT